MHRVLCCQMHMHYCTGGQPYFSHDDRVGSTLSDQLCTRPIFSMIPSFFPPDSSPWAQPSVLMEANLQTIANVRLFSPHWNMTQSNPFLTIFQTNVSLSWMICVNVYNAMHEKNGKCSLPYFFITSMYLSVINAADFTRVLGLSPVVKRWTGEGRVALLIRESFSFRTLPAPTISRIECIGMAWKAEEAAVI